MYDVVVIGAGISGITIAERYANVCNKKVLIIDKREHIGGNCYDYTNSDGILVPKYGPHFFHTNSEKVWKYVNTFSEWLPYEHRVLSAVDGQLVPIPVNITTVNMIMDANISNEAEMKKWLRCNVKHIQNPTNSEEVSLNLVGKTLYEKLFKNYTRKQWGLWPKQLDASVLRRIPIRTNFDDRYFSDKYQALPKPGYTQMFKKMLDNPNIHIRLGTDYLRDKPVIKKSALLFYTGPIDSFFAKKFGKLGYRSLRFEHHTLNMKRFQKATQINYPNTEKYTRITEPKNATGQRHPKTTIIKEYSSAVGEPYYPIPNKINQKIFSEYKVEAKKAEKSNIYFVGRLADYRYFNMDQAFENALNLFENISGN